MLPQGSRGVERKCTNPLHLRPQSHARSRTTGGKYIHEIGFRSEGLVAGDFMHFDRLEELTEASGGLFCQHSAAVWLGQIARALEDLFEDFGDFEDGAIVERGGVRAI